MLYKTTQEEDPFKISEDIKFPNLTFPDGKREFPGSSALNGKTPSKLGFSTEGMVDRGKGIVGYGIADISDYLNNASDNYTTIPTVEYMSRLTGIPRDMQLKFINETNRRRAAIPPALRFLKPIPGTLRVATNKLQLGLVGDKMKAELGSHSCNVVGVPNYVYAQKTGGMPVSFQVAKYLPGLVGLLYIKANLIYNGYNNENQRLTPGQIREGASLMFNDTDVTFADTIKHEVAHQNTSSNIHFPEPLYGDLHRWDFYDSMSPDYTFNGGTYFSKQVEAWGAANRIKNDAAGLYYRKYGHLPGFDAEGNVLLVDSIRKSQIKEALDMYFSKDNPGIHNIENIRIRNQLQPEQALPGVIPGSLLMKLWMLSDPMYSLPETLSTLMWDIAHRGNGNINKTASANLTGLCKAASIVKQAGKIMAVKVTKMDTSLGRLKMRVHYVYMPDCSAYRDIIKNGTAAKKAALANKFWLNQTPACTLVGCDLEIVDKS